MARLATGLALINNNYAMARLFGEPPRAGAVGLKHSNAIYAAVNTFEQYASPVAPNR